MRAILANPGDGAIPRPRRVAEADDTPFLPLSQLARIGFLFYLFAYRLIFPLLTSISDPGAKDLFELRFLAEIFYTSLLAYPFIFYRREYGWLHPLVLPVLWTVGKALAKNPLSLFFPFQMPLVDFTVETVSKAAVLSVSNYDLAWYRLEATLIDSLAQAVYLTVFLVGMSFKIPRVQLSRPASVALPAMVSIGAMLGIAAVFVVAKGGISEVLVAMRGGRRALFEGYGQYVAAAQLAPIIALIWFGYEKKPFKNPLFLAGLAMALLACLLVTGSRSSVVLSVFMLVLLWWWKQGKALILPTVAAALVGVIVVGGFGAIRQDYQSTAIDLSVFNPTQLGETIGRAYQEIEKRGNEDSSIAVVVGADRKGYLWGRSYMNAATFWVPRGLWPDKPVGVDVYNMWINFNDNSIGDSPPATGVWGIPVDGSREAYWNFGYFGVAVIFALMGVLHSTLAKAAHVYRKVPIFWVFYFYTLLYVNATSRSVADSFKTLAIVVLFALIAGIVPWGRRKAALADGRN